MATLDPARLGDDGTAIRARRRQEGRPRLRQQRVPARPGAAQLRERCEGDGGGSPGAGVRGPDDHGRGAACVQPGLVLAGVADQWPCRAEGTFPRDGNEALALRLHHRYKDNIAALARLEAERKGLIADLRGVASAGLGTGFAITEDTARLNQINSEVSRLRAQSRELEGYWGKNRGEPPATPRSFAWRYGPLSEVSKPSTDPRYDQVEAAIRFSPFIPATPTSTRPIVQGTWVMTSSSDGGNCNGTSMSFRQAPDGSATSAEANVPCEKGVATGHWTGSNFRWVGANTLTWTYQFTTRSVERLQNGSMTLTFLSATAARETARDAAGNTHWGEYRKQ